MKKKKFIIATTVPISLYFFKGQIQELKKKFEVILVSSPGVLLKDICKAEKVDGFPVSMKREISLYSDIISLFSMIKLFRKIKPDVVHGNTPKGGLISMFAAWFNRVPTRIYYIHGLRYQETNGVKRKLLVNMERLSCFFSTHVYAVSFGVKKMLKEDKITKKKVCIIGNGSVNGIDTSFFSIENNNVFDIRNSLGLTTKNFVFGFVGRLVKDKGINELVEAFSQINRLKPESRLLLVGNFENGDPIDIDIKNIISNNKSIIAVGFQKDVRSYYKAMDVFVFPSYREGFGISLMEAAAMGIPSISTDIIGCNEIISDGYNGILIKPKSVEKLFEAMKMLISDKAIINNMAEVSRKYVENKYEQKKLWEKTLESYSSIS
ncbi:glycosyltransferase family 4 protein [Lutibacter sp.]|uniref:glycosyltransferase family 4 protein n=1 Tax=Lutibacter sp. TaxID=1925666 RepID=UPI0025C51372|nr:glycosyltransferase family 4 protein [Lutibacter sp.]MCF6182096.1 glycosyltransferase family 4 protein [Lutibacter sp.]